VVAGFARDANAYAAAVVPEGAASPDPTMPQVRIRHSTASSGPARLELSDNARSGLSFPGKPVFSDVLTVTNPSLTAPHNLVNAAFAALMARLYGMPLEACQRAIDRFEGLEHRYVTVGEFARMRFIDDSKATNVHAAQVAIRSTPGEIVLLAGGLGKGESYAGLVEAGEGRITRVYTFGTAGPAIADAFAGKAEVRAVGNMAEALTDVTADAIAGATVLLAPACASFDQFKSYKDRGDQFAQFIREKVAATTARGGAA
jgi:UDP-N-acetylmuramoylalanine-D-glutamate ligase